MKTIVRKISVCAKCNCMTCPLNEYAVPDDCEYAFKHLLCTEEEGVVVDLPRRGGKTRRVIAMAMELLSHGRRVMIFVPTAQVGNDLQRRMMGTGVQIASVGGWKVNKTSGQNKVWSVLSAREPMYILSDEVYPWIADFVKKHGTHRFVVGFYSSVG